MKVNQFTKKPRRMPIRSKNQGRSPSENAGSDEATDNRSRHTYNGANKNYQQQVDKYLNLAKDHLSSGDRVMAEYNYQYADHYIRLMNERNEQRAQRQHVLPSKEVLTTQNILDVATMPAFQPEIVSKVSVE